MQRKIFATAFLLALMLSYCSFAEEKDKPQQGVIRVEISGLRNDKGQVLCVLFSSPSDFPKKMDKAIAHAASVIASGRAACEFPRRRAGNLRRFRHPR